MDVLVYNGKRYTRNNAKWVDSDSLAVCETLQLELNRMFVESLDVSQFTIEQLVKEGDKFKNSYTYNLAIIFYEKAVDLGDEKIISTVLPRITSCYRHCKNPRKVIEIFSSVKQRFGASIFNTALLTSVAAAYCDLGEYENAFRCCRWAYKEAKGEFSQELSNVFARIKKESGIE